MIFNILTFSAVLGLAGTNTVLHKNGYEGVVIAIGAEVPEDKQIVENLKVSAVSYLITKNYYTKQ